MDITDFTFENGDADYLDEIWFFRIFLQKSPLYFFTRRVIAAFFIKRG